MNARAITFTDGPVDHTCDADADTVVQICRDEACINSGMVYRHTALTVVQVVAGRAQHLAALLDRLADRPATVRPLDTSTASFLCALVDDAVATVSRLPQIITSLAADPNAWRHVTDPLFRDGVAAAFARAAEAVDDTGRGWLTARAMYDLQRHRPGVARLGLVPTLAEHDRRRLGGLVNVVDASAREVAAALTMCPSGEYAVAVEDVRCALARSGPAVWPLLAYPPVVFDGASRVSGIWWLPTALAVRTATELADSFEAAHADVRVRVLPLPRPNADPDLFTAFTALWRPEAVDSLLADAQVAFDAARGVALPATS